MSEGLYFYEDSEYYKTHVLNYEGVEKRKEEVRKYLEDWKLCEENLSNEEENEVVKYYYRHPYSKLLFDVIKIKFEDGEEIMVPKYNSESDDDKNSGYKVIKDRGKEKRIYLSEMTYTVKSDGKVVRMSFDDFWETRKGKRYQKYLKYFAKRKEKKRVYDQERYKRSQVSYN